MLSGPSCLPYTHPHYSASVRGSPTSPALAAGGPLDPSNCGPSLLGFALRWYAWLQNLSSPSLSKVWEFDQAHQRWLPVAEMVLPEDKDDQVYAVAWAPNIGRPYETIAVATPKGLAIWNLGLNPDHDGRLPVERIALFSGHEGEVWQMEWDMSGMTLATVGHDGMVRLWQSNLNGAWHQQAAFEPTS